MGSSLYRFRPENGLILHERAARAFDNGALLIVQTEDSSAERPEFEIIAV